MSIKTFKEYQPLKNLLLYFFFCILKVVIGGKYINLNKITKI